MDSLICSLNESIKQIFIPIIYVAMLIITSVVNKDHVRKIVLSNVSNKGMDTQCYAG